ncbi:anoctamin-6-like isoform X2 [Hyposmocoma kahamanoa]|uniref:anoctamin-6-like isoform X2 n=1 Tax=Hyposmocoma kahamanoa TaxID=1477025 RepID=UPI000E6D7C9C|nr:anoctamin-6-like isoform X2 [Hyposmocoma kahamanoa]
MLDDLSIFEEHHIKTCVKCFDETAKKWAQKKSVNITMTDRYLLREGFDDFPAYTGMFRDNHRRVDYVIVLSASEDAFYTDDIKAQFLTTLVKIGLELEIERGVMKEYNNLLFVKIYTPDVVLDSHAEYYGVNQDFQANHANFMGPLNWFTQGSSLWPRDEKEWILLLRKRYLKPLRLSNRDRSYITYMLIKHQPFGEGDKNYGFHRLLNHKIVIDGYALHDGPYFFTSEQPVSQLNGRQVLFYKWANYNQLFRLQPINVLNEYFGPKIAMYFAFYQFYMGMLSILTVFSLAISGLWFFYYILQDIDQICTDKFLKPSEDLESFGWKRDGLTSCPPCQDFKACPVLIQNCWIWTIVSFWRLFYFLLPAFSFWVLLFFLLWRRKYNFYRWLWELKHTLKNSIVRPEYTVQYKGAYRSKVTGIWETRKTLAEIFVWPIDMLVFVFSFGSIIGVMVGSYYARNIVLSMWYADKKLTVNPLPPTVDPHYNKLWYDSRIFYDERMDKVTTNEMDLYILAGLTAIQVIILYCLERSLHLYEIAT